MITVAVDFKGRRLSLLSRVARITNGTRYVTRNSVAKVIRKEAKYTHPRYCNSQAPHGWPAKATQSRVKIGCHVWTGNEARKIIEWALA